MLLKGFRSCFLTLQLKLDSVDVFPELTLQGLCFPVKVDSASVILFFQVPELLLEGIGSRRLVFEYGGVQ